MFKKSLQVTAFVSTVIMSVGVAAPISQGATVKHNANMRKGASTKYKVTGVLQKGEEVKILSQSNGWYKIQDSDNEKGWTYNTHINASDKELQNTTDKNSGVVRFNLNFRKGPSTDEKIISVLQTGEKVKILSQSNGWYKVQNSSGKVGWAYGKYIKTSDKKDDTNGTFKDTANVRKGASTKYSVIETLKKGQKVKVISSLDGWYKIKCPDGQVGWTHGSHIDSSVPLYKYKSENKSKKSSDSSTTLSKLSSKKISNSKNSVTYGSKSGNKMVVSATAYSGDSITSTGTTPKFGTIAVDPSVIPYGTKVYIPRFGQTFIAEDCGGGIKGNRIDIFMNSESECNSWGVRSITIEILD